MGIVWENTTPSIELSRNFCARRCVCIIFFFSIHGQLDKSIKSSVYIIVFSLKLGYFQNILSNVDYFLISLVSVSLGSSSSWNGQRCCWGNVDQSEEWCCEGQAEANNTRSIGSWSMCSFYLWIYLCSYLSLSPKEVVVVMAVWYLYWSHEDRCEYLCHCSFGHQKLSAIQFSIIIKQQANLNVSFQFLIQSVWTSHDNISRVKLVIVSLLLI